MTYPAPPLILIADDEADIRALLKILLEKEIIIECAMNSGESEATALGCDLSYEYVHINGDYRS